MCCSFLSSKTQFHWASNQMEWLAFAAISPGSSSILYQHVLNNEMNMHSKLYVRDIAAKIETPFINQWCTSITSRKPSDDKSATRNPLGKFLRNAPFILRKRVTLTGSHSTQHETENLKKPACAFMNVSCTALYLLPITALPRFNVAARNWRKDVLLQR